MFEYMEIKDTLTGKTLLVLGIPESGCLVIDIQGVVEIREGIKEASIGKVIRSWMRARRKEKLL